MPLKRSEEGAESPLTMLQPDGAVEEAMLVEPNSKPPLVSLREAVATVRTFAGLSGSFFSASYWSFSRSVASAYFSAAVMPPSSSVSFSRVTLSKKA